MLQFTYAGGDGGLDLPASAISMIEDMTGKNENLPTAKVFLRYQLGDDFCIACVEDSFDSCLLRIIGAVGPDQHIVVKRNDDMRMLILKNNVVSRSSLKPEENSGARTRLSVVLHPGSVGSFLVVEPIEELRDMMLRPVIPPTNLVPDVPKADPLPGRIASKKPTRKPTPVRVRSKAQKKKG